MTSFVEEVELYHNTTQFIYVFSEENRGYEDY